MQIKTIIVDDEELARNRLLRLMSSLPHIEVIGEAVNGLEAVSLVQSRQADLLFLDINMPKMSGLEAAREIINTVDQPPAIIFCTAYDEFALEAFEVNASAYLLKPVTKEDLIRVIDVARQLTMLQISNLEEDVGSKRANLISIHHSGSRENLNLKDVNYFRSEGKHIVAGVVDGREVIVDSTLKLLESSFPELLIRVHRNTLVNRGRILKLQKGEGSSSSLLLKDCERKFNISRRHLSQVKQCFL